ncbi:hypothetical protein D9M72_572880 [compost metagenome]
MLRAGDHADRRQVLQRVVRHAREQARVDGQRHRLQPDGVAIGRRLGDRVDADVAAGTGAVLHHDGAAEALGPGIRDQARGDVGAAAGGIRHDQADRALGIGLGGGGASGGGEGRGASHQGRQADKFHGRLLWDELLWKRSYHCPGET